MVIKNVNRILKFIKVLKICIGGIGVSMSEKKLIDDVIEVNNMGVNR